MAVEVASAYVSLLARTGKLEESIKESLTKSTVHADAAGAQIGARLARTADKALRSGWKPDESIMAGIPDTKLDRIGARIGQVIGKGVVGGLKAREAGRQFGASFADGAGSVGLGSVMSGWRKDLQGQSSKIGYVAGKAMSAGLQSALAVGVGGATLMLKSGFDRLVKLDTAQYKLRQVLKTSGRESDFDRIYKAVQSSVDKTPFSLDQAFGTAVQAVGAGSQDIERFMKNVADAAGFAGVELDRMGLVFNQVLAKGKLTGEETMQLMEAGLPARSWIQDSYKLTSEQFDKMQQDGQITLDMLQKSIEDHAPGMAKALGNTLQGSIDNMKTAFARTGANLLAALFGGPTGDATEGLKSAVARITEMLEKLNSWITAHSDEIRQFFLGAKESAGTLFDVLGQIATTLGEHPGLITAVVGAFAAWKTIEGVAALASALGAINTLLGVTLPGSAASGVAAMSASFAPLLTMLGPLIGLVGLGAAMDNMDPNSPDFQKKLGRRGLGALSQGNKDAIGALADTAAAGIGAGGLLGGSGAGLNPGAAAMRSAIAQAFPQITDIGGYRPPDVTPYGTFTEHSSGNAIDVMIPPSLVGTPAGKALGDQIVAYALQSGGSYALWQQQSWKPGQGPTGMRDRGSPTQNHMDHVHIYMGGAGSSPGWSTIPTISTPDGSNPVRGGNPTGADLLKRLAGISTYDTGGWLPDGYTLVKNATGKDELILNPEQQKALAESGVDPQALLNGTHQGSGALPGPGSVHAGSGAAPGPAAATPPFLDNLIRTQGFTPTGGGGVAGTSSVAKFIGMGNEVVGGLIDTGASLAQTAITAATTAAGGALASQAGPAGPLAGMAANAAASYGVQLGAAELKRISSYGFQLAGIGADAAIAQMFPFGGPPRWMGYDYTAFAPQLGIQKAALTTIEQMGAQAIEQAFPKPPEQAAAASAPTASALGPQQLAPPAAVPGVQIGQINGMSPADVAAEIDKQQRLSAMRFSGRP